MRPQLGFQWMLLAVLTGMSPLAAAFPLSPPAISSARGRLAPRLRADRLGPLSRARVVRRWGVRVLASGAAADDIRDAFSKGLSKMGQQGPMDEALSDLVSSASDAFSSGVTYPALLDSLSSDGLDEGAVELRNRMLALIFLACEGCNYPRQGGGSAQTPEKYRKAYGTFIRNLVVLRQAGITYSQFVMELKQDDPQWLQDLQTRVEQKKGAALTLNGVSIPPGLVDVAMLVMLTFDIVISKAPE